MKNYIFSRLPRFVFFSAILAALLLLQLMPGILMPGIVVGQEPAPPGITVVLVIDDSGSMAETDPNQRRGLGGRLLIERLFPEDQIATVLFSSHARVVRTVSPIGTDENRDHTKSSFKLLQASGATDMLDALNKAFIELEQDSTENPKLVVFLTDGQLLLPDGESQADRLAFEDLLKSYRGNEWPIFPISFGVDVDTQFLKNVAEITGGETCDAPNDSELVACFQTVLDTFKQTERVLEVQPICLAAGEAVDYPVHVDPYARQLSIVLAREDSSVETAVFDPVGELLRTVTCLDLSSSTLTDPSQWCF